ncbi:MAG: hypothetical protein GY953_09225, partial [bacterium]|nr:hypothetical protein [bacterium]
MLVAFVFLFTAWSAVAGCLSFDDTAAGCERASGELVWQGATTPLVETGRGRSFYDETIWARPPGRGVRLEGDSTFELRAEGRHLVEVFLVVTGQWKHSYLLEADGEVADDRWRAWVGPDRKMPTGGKRRITLLAMVDGPVRLPRRPGSPEFVLTAIRWAGAQSFESMLLPSWRKRARWLARHALFEERGFSPTDRRHRLQQVHAR